MDVRWTHGACGVFLCAALLTIGCGKRQITPEDRLRAQELIGHGVRLAERDELDSARMVFQRAVALDSTNAEGHYRLGVVYEYTGNPMQAEGEYRRAIAHDSTLAEAHFNLGQLLGRTQRYDEALAHFDAALRHTSNDRLRALTYYCIGLTYGIQGNAPEAADAYGHAVQIDTAFARAYVGKGQELLRQGRAEEAIPALERAIALDSALTEAYGHLATAYRMLGRMEDALAAEQRLRRALEAERARE